MIGAINAISNIWKSIVEMHPNTIVDASRVFILLVLNPYEPNFIFTFFNLV